MASSSRSVQTKNTFPKMSVTRVALFPSLKMTMIERACKVFIVGAVQVCQKDGDTRGSVSEGLRVVTLQGR